MGHLIDAFPAGDPTVVPTINDMLQRYSEALTGWATRTATRMLVEVDARDRLSWAELAGEMSRELRREIQTAPTGELFQALLNEQVTLIKSIPLEAAQRVHELTIKGLEDSTRASEIAKEIGRSGEVATSRANLIARTEVARTASDLTEARAIHVGSVEYVWRTAGDSDVRDSHKAMNGKVVRWDSPPTLDGMKGHAGRFPNCRCYPEPILPE